MLAEQMSGSIARAAANYDLTVPRLELLFVLGLQGECKQVELATYLDCSPRQVTASPSLMASMTAGSSSQPVSSPLR